MKDKFKKQACEFKNESECEEELDEDEFEEGPFDEEGPVDEDDY